ncbi:hypothetical protein HKX48_001322 [Thoreauomyces humboldtii]|nr:hypothetical protein HKX48_001322 [Thoreauomyces humboldtii]
MSMNLGRNHRHSLRATACLLPTISAACGSIRPSRAVSPSARCLATETSFDVHARTKPAVIYFAKPAVVPSVEAPVLTLIGEKCGVAPAIWSRFFSLVFASTRPPIVTPIFRCLGPGKLAIAIVEGLHAADRVHPRNITLSCRRPEHRDQLQRTQKGRVGTVTVSNHDAIANGQRRLAQLAQRDAAPVCSSSCSPSHHRHILFLTVKPTDFPALCQSIGPLVRQCKPLVVSATPGISSAQLQHWLTGSSEEGVAIVRCMPNTPTAVRQGAVAIVPNGHASARDLALVKDIFSSVCPVVEVLQDEAMLNSVASLSGSGPAYFLYLLEVMEQAGKDLGLTPTAARELAIQSCVGAGALAQSRVSRRIDGSSSRSPRSSFHELRQSIAPPGGSTQEAFRSLDADGWSRAVRNAMQASYRKNVAMGSED